MEGPGKCNVVSPRQSWVRTKMQGIMAQGKISQRPALIAESHKQDCTPHMYMCVHMYAMYVSVRMSMHG